jgi:hypothetical protein
MALRCRRHNGKAKKQIRRQLQVCVNAEADHQKDTQMLTLYLRFVIPLGKLDSVQTNDVTDSGRTRALQSVLTKKKMTTTDEVSRLAVSTLMKRLARTG